MISETEASHDTDQTDGNTSFLRAARDGNLTEVLEYLKGSTDINTSNPNGLNALHLASKEGHIDIVTELLTRGANVEAATKKGNTALHIASLAGHEEIVKLLVANGAKVNVQAQTGFTPLYMAAQEGHADVVKFLLANGASQSLSTVMVQMVNNNNKGDRRSISSVSSQDGFTPLAVALQQGHERVVAVLLEHDTKGKVRLPALHIAAKKDDTKSAALLLQNEQNAVDLQTKSGFTPLHIASHYGNVNVGKLLIQRGADVNFKAKNNITPLHVAARWGKNNMITLLLDNKAVIDERTRDGLTPLHCAARSGHESVVDTLLIRGAPYQSKTKNGLTPLHMAAQGDHVDCARLLLYHKAPVDDVTMDYLTPLHVAAHCGNVNTAKLLLDRKCDPNGRALNGFTPLHIACKKNRIKVVELLLKYGASIEATTESGLSPLHVASFMGHMNIVIYLIQHDAKPDYPTVRGETALHLAARAQQTDIIRILLRNGATVDALAREQQTPLHIAARLGNVDNVVLLLQHGAKPDAVTKDLYTPLHIAAKEGHEEVASVLLEHDANLNLTTKKGFTPLHIAAKYGQLKVAKLLLQKDANPDVQGKNGLTPLHVATHYNHVSVALLLLNNKASPHSTAKNGYTPLHIAAKKNQMDIATTLLEYGAKPDAESKNGFTPLHLASQEGHTDMVSLLLEHKGNVNSKSNNGLTPMHLAAQEDKVPVAEVLVKYGSEIDPQTKAGYTPLHTACHFGQANMVRYLLEHQASVNSTTKLGYTPLHQAAQQGQVNVVNLLLKHKASPNAVTNNGQTALSIAQRLGYISVVDTLEGITEVTETVPASDDKYKVVSPETMQETFLSDSEDEGDVKWKRLTLTSFGEDSLSDRGGSASPLDTSYDRDVVMRNPKESEDARRHMKSEISSALHYPSYLERGPDYEAEMRYFSGETLSPREKEQKTFSGDYSTLDRLDSDAAKRPIRSVDASMNSLDADDYVTEDLMKKDYMEAQMVGSYEAPIMPSTADNRYMAAPGKSEGTRFSSYSGSSFNTHFDPDNVAIDKSPVYSGKLKWKSFLVSFMVDARGGALRGTRHSGVRFIIPPGRAAMPTRILCRLIKKEKLLHPPVLNEGEALANRILEMGPHGTKFLGPVLLEVPHFASLRDKEREIQILRSDNGETWYEHPIIATEDAVATAMAGTFEEFEGEDELNAKRITRILTSDLPQYFAIVSRVRIEHQMIGDDGGVISSKVVPQVQAVFPQGALNKRIKVGLQAQPIAPEIISKLCGNRVACSPIVTVEPRRRKFHKPITLTIPVPKAAQKGMINQYPNENPSLRLLCSITGGANSAVWEDITENKNLQFTNDCVSFTTTVSARFWLMDCQATQESASMATEIYHEAVTVPYMARFVVFAKRNAMEEGQMRMFCMTDDRTDKTLEKQQHFVEVARSRDVEVLEGRPQFVEMAGNLIPVTKSGDQLFIDFKAFRENRLPCTVRIRDQDQEPAARVAFMKEPKVARGEVPQIPICNLNITLPGWSKSSSMEMEPGDSLEVRKRHSLLREHGIVLEDSISRAQIKLIDVADTLQGDWVILAQQLDITGAEINQIKSDYNTVNDQALAMLQLWVAKKGQDATGNALENGLRQVGREDVIRKTMYNVEVAEDELEAAANRAAMDQSGFDNFAEEVGISRDSSLKKGMSLDVQFDEQDIIKESESAEECSISSEGETRERRVAPQAPTEGDNISISEDLIAEVDERRKVATQDSDAPDISSKKKEAYLDLIMKMDEYEDEREKRNKQNAQEELDDTASVGEDTIVQESKATVESAIDRITDLELKATVAEAEPAEAKPSEDGSPVDEEEGVRTPPPSPEEILVQDEIKKKEVAIDQLAARLSEPLDEDDGKQDDGESGQNETSHTREQTILPGTVSVEEAIIVEHAVTTSHQLPSECVPSISDNIMHGLPAYEEQMAYETSDIGDKVTVPTGTITYSIKEIDRVDEGSVQLKRKLSSSNSDSDDEFEKSDEKSTLKNIEVSDELKRKSSSQSSSSSSDDDDGKDTEKNAKFELRKGGDDEKDQEEAHSKASYETKGHSDSSSSSDNEYFEARTSLAYEDRESSQVAYPELDLKRVVSPVAEPENDKRDIVSPVAEPENDKTDIVSPSASPIADLEYNKRDIVSPVAEPEYDRKDIVSPVADPEYDKRDIVSPVAEPEYNKKDILKVDLSQAVILTETAETEEECKQEKSPKGEYVRTFPVPDMTELIIPSERDETAAITVETDVINSKPVEQFFSGPSQNVQSQEPSEKKRLHKKVTFDESVIDNERHTSDESSSSEDSGEESDLSSEVDSETDTNEKLKGKDDIKYEAVALEWDVPPDRTESVETTDLDADFEDVQEGASMNISSVLESDQEKQNIKFTGSVECPDEDIMKLTMEKTADKIGRYGTESDSNSDSYNKNNESDKSEKKKVENDSDDNDEDPYKREGLVSSSTSSDSEDGVTSYDFHHEQTEKEFLADDQDVENYAQAEKNLSPSTETNQNSDTLIVNMPESSTIKSVEKHDIPKFESPSSSDSEKEDVDEESKIQTVDSLAQHLEPYIEIQHVHGQEDTLADPEKAFKKQKEGKSESSSSSDSEQKDGDEETHNQNKVSSPIVDTLTGNEEESVCHDYEKENKYQEPVKKSDDTSDNSSKRKVFETDIDNVIKDGEGGKEIPMIPRKASSSSSSSDSENENYLKEKSVAPQDVLNDIEPEPKNNVKVDASVNIQETEVIAEKEPSLSSSSNEPGDDGDNDIQSFEMIPRSDPVETDIDAVYEREAVNVLSEPMRKSSASSERENEAENGIKLDDGSNNKRVFESDIANIIKDEKEAEEELKIPTDTRKASTSSSSSSDDENETKENLASQDDLNDQDTQFKDNSEKDAAISIPDTDLIGRKEPSSSSSGSEVEDDGGDKDRNSFETIPIYDPSETDIDAAYERQAINVTSQPKRRSSTSSSERENEVADKRDKGNLEALKGPATPSEPIETNVDAIMYSTEKALEAETHTTPSSIVEKRSSSSSQSSENESFICIPKEAETNRVESFVNVVDPQILKKHQESLKDEIETEYPSQIQVHSSESNCETETPIDFNKPYEQDITETDIDAVYENQKVKPDQVETNMDAILSEQAKPKRKFSYSSSSSSSESEHRSSSGQGDFHVKPEDSVKPREDLDTTDDLENTHIDPDEEYFKIINRPHDLGSAPGSYEPEYVAEQYTSSIPVEVPPDFNGAKPPSDEVYCETSLTVVRRVKVKQTYTSERTERQPTTIESALSKNAEQPKIVDVTDIEKKSKKRPLIQSESSDEELPSKRRETDTESLEEEFEAPPPAREYIIQEPGVDQDRIQMVLERHVKEPQFVPGVEKTSPSESETEAIMFEVEEPVFDPQLQGGETVYEEKKPDGSIIKRHRIKHLPHGHVSFDQTENVEYYEEEGPVRVETEIEDEEEVLEDGTVHRIHHVRKHSLQHVRRSLRSETGEEDVVEDADVQIPGTQHEDIIETYEEPPKKVTQFEEEEETLDDGTKVTRQVIMSSMVKKIRTRTKSIDEGGHEEEQEEEIDEVVPGTQSCFIARDDDSSSSSSFIDDLDEMAATIEEEDETLPDGTFIRTTLLEAHEKRKSRSRSGSIDESEDQMIIKERRVTPAPSPSGSPRSGSPTNIEDLAAEIAQKTIHSAHIEVITHKKGDEIEQTTDYRTDDYLPPQSQGQIGQGEDESDDDEVEGAEGGETHATRITMKKEIHTKTVLKDGEEQTFVHEDSQVETDPNAPEELRESMQQIIEEFMGSPTEAQKTLEDDV